jgi:hypothetical protein
MNHKQILDKLAARGLVEAVEDDVRRAVFWAMAGPRDGKPDHAAVSARVVDDVLRRWNCVFAAAPEDVTPNYRDKTAVAVATVLHNYGIPHPPLIEHAMTAIDHLNAEVALSDDFYRKSPAIKDFLQAPPKPLMKRPARPAEVTFWRAGDVAALQLGRHFYAAYVHEILHGSAVPIIELYDYRATTRPSIDALRNLPAKGARFNDGVVRAERLYAHGMKFQPDPAYQFHLIASGMKTGPDSRRLGTPIGHGNVLDIFRLFRWIETNFAETKTPSP